ncbi:MAG TPA: glycosyltransferase [Methylomirabilota bacterium]|nr:glycosyltransferase [Methylomirabilota bacterium]
MLPRARTIALYTHAAVFVCPSVYEPFGIINLEAMACETPVVASAVGGIVEVVEDGKTGLLVPPAQPEVLAQALTRVLDNPELGRRMGKAGRARVEARFSWASVAERTEEVYAEAIAEFKRSVVD